MKEGTEEKDIMEVVHCKGLGKLLKMGDCNIQSCPEFHGGIKKEPIQKRENGVVAVVGYNKYVICQFPQLQQVHTICEV